MSSSTTSTQQPARPVNTKQPAPPNGGSSSSLASPRGANAAGAKATPDTDRKLKLVHSTPILKEAVKEQHCSEDDLIQALTIATFTDGEYVFCQGQPERDIYFIEEGKILITQRRAGTGPVRLSARRRSVQEAELEIQIMTFEEYDYFGEMALLQNATRKSNAVASGSTTCMSLKEEDFQVLLAPLHQLMLYRYLMRSHSVLEKHRLFKEFSPAQRQHIINHCTLETYQDNDFICRQNDIDDRFFILAEGEANVVIDEMILSPAESRSNSLMLAELGECENSAMVLGATISTVKRGDGRGGGRVQSSTVAQKSLYQGFGEMGLLGKQRTAHVVARGDPVLCIVITRKDYIAASQLMNNAIDVDAESLLATTLIEEWNLVINARNLHLSNPQVAHYLVTFIKKFKAAYNQKFVGKTMYLDFLRRLHQEPQLGEEFEFLSSRVTWDSPASSLGIIRSESRRILSSPPSMRTPPEMSFISRMIENTVFLDKFEMPASVDKHKVARHLGKVVDFLNIGKDQYLFRQGKIESKAFLILRGKINIVNEDVNSMQTVKHYEVIATLSAGDSFGELSLVTRLQRSATAMSPCDTDLLVLDRDRLHMIMAALPGVNVRHEMVERAEFLSRLDFFKGCDFGQCIRVAHDMQQNIYEPHHLFLKGSVHLRTLYIVKSGEIAVFLKKTVPASAIPSLSGNLSPAASTAGALLPAKTVLIRVATIGPQEFFGVAVAFANITGAAPVSVSTSSGAASLPGGAQPMTNLAGSFQQQQHSLHSATSQAEMAATVYMCCTRVQVLELSERGWRRLTPQSLQIIRNSLLERNRWNHELVETQKDPSYFHVEKPWQVLARANPVTGKFDERQSTQLARHLRDKKQNATSAYALFLPDRDTGSKMPSSPTRSLASRGNHSGRAEHPSSTQHQCTSLKTPPVSPRALPVVSFSGLPSSSLGGSFATGLFSPHPPSPSSCVRTPSAVSPAMSSSPVHSRSPNPIPNFVRILSPIIPHPQTSRGSPCRPGRVPKSSPGRTESSSAATGAPSEMFESMWKLQRRPSLH